MDAKQNVACDVSRNGSGVCPQRESEVAAILREAAPLRQEVLRRLLEEEMELEKAVLSLSQEKRQCDAQGLW